MKQKQAKRISCQQTYHEGVAKGIPLNRKDMIKQRTLIRQGEINTVRKSRVSTIALPFPLEWSTLCLMIGIQVIIQSDVVLKKQRELGGFKKTS